MKLAIIGVGKMGGAILEGIIKANLLLKKDILLICRREEQKVNLEKEGYEVSLNVEDAYKTCDYILISIKPQIFPKVFDNSNKFDFSKKCIISIAAGVKMDELSNYFVGSTIVRGMPNTSALINESVTTVCSTNKDSKAYEEAIKIFKSIGEVVEIKEEEMDTTLPLNGSMPAYIYYFIKCFIDAAVKSGVEYNDAKKLVANTIISSTKMLLNSSEDIQTLINNVCSKGGTTIAGLKKMTSQSMDTIIEECYNACRDRSLELANK